MPGLKVSAVTEYEAKKMLAGYGIKVPGNVIVGKRFVQPGFDGPYVVKVSDPSILHKTEAGGVILGLKTHSELEEAVETMKRRFPESNILIEEMLAPGVEIIAGVLRDPQFGLVVMAGLGGIYAELLRDRAFRLVPLTGRDAEDMVMQTRLSGFVQGFRGLRIRLDSIRDLIVKLSEFAMDHDDELEGVDLNPVIANSSGLTVADAKIVFRNSRKLDKEGK